MNLVTLGALTPARSANRATLSSPAIGYEARKTLASLRSAGLRLAWRWRTSSATRSIVSFVTPRFIQGPIEKFLTRILVAASVAAAAGAVSSGRFLHEHRQPGF